MELNVAANAAKEIKGAACGAKRWWFADATRLSGDSALQAGYDRNNENESNSPVRTVPNSSAYTLW